MPRVQTPPVRMPPSLPSIFETPSFPSFSLPKFDFSRALTTRNIAIVLGAGFIAWMAYRYLFSSPKTDKNYSTPILTPTTSTPDNELKLNLQEESQKIFRVLYLYENDPWNETNLTNAIKAIELLNSHSDSLTKAQIRNISIDGPLAFVEDKLPNRALVFQHMQTLNAPAFLCNLALQRFKEQLTAELFEKLKLGTSLNTASQELSNQYASIFSSNQVKDIPIKLEDPTRQALQKCWEEAQTSMAFVVDGSTLSTEDLLQESLPIIAKNYKNALPYQQALLLHVTTKKMPPDAFVSMLKSWVSKMDPEKSWNLLAKLNHEQPYDQAHWCIDAIRDLLPLMLWEMTPSDLAELKLVNDEMTYYVDQLEVIEKLKTNPNLKCPTFFGSGMRLLVALSIVRLKNQTPSEKLQDRLKQLSQFFDPPNDKLKRCEVLKTTYHKELIEADTLLTSTEDSKLEENETSDTFDDFEGLNNTHSNVSLISYTIFTNLFDIVEYSRLDTNQTMKSAGIQIQLLNTNLASFTQAEIRNVSIDRDLLDDANLSHIALVFQQLQALKAPTFLSELVVNAFKEQLTSEMFIKLQERKKLDQACNELSEQYSSLFSPTQLESSKTDTSQIIKVEAQTVQMAWSCLNEVQESMTFAIEKSQLSTEKLLLESLPVIAKNREKALLYQHALILHVTNKDIQPDKFIALLKQVINIENLEDEKVWSFLGNLNHLQPYDQAHWCIDAIRDLLPIILWDMSPNDLEKLPTSNKEIASYIDQLDLIEKLKTDPDFEFPDELYWKELHSSEELTLALALARLKGQKPTEQLASRLQFTQLPNAKQLQDKSERCEPLQTTYHKELSKASLLNNLAFSEEED